MLRLRVRPRMREEPQPASAGAEVVVRAADGRRDLADEEGVELAVRGLGIQQAEEATAGRSAVCRLGAAVLSVGKFA